ncbi:MAG TPA: hypothetical protein VLT51_04275 [Anaerolineales bacterium]|nr:hypothetical protein [Anaerolineales bacterium]
MKSSGKKLFLWFITFILIMACAPSMVTPVPPLDPNAINTFVAQTADAASTRTQVALPPAATSTSTPRSTFTPESTSTTLPVIVFPTLTPIQRVQFFRVKHDSQIARYNYQSRTAAKNWHGINLFTPETVPLFVLPEEGTGTWRTKVDGSWEIYINSLNNNDAKKLRYLKADNTALFNTAGFPQLESLTMGGNVITLVEIQGDWGRVGTIDYNIKFKELEDVNYETRPDLIHKFVVVGYKRDTKTTYWLNPPHGDIYWPLVSSRAVWISLDRLEPFPFLPMEVTAKTSQVIRKTPTMDGEETGEEFSEGESARIVEYYPSGSNVWGRISGGGWVTLLLHWKYPTSWSMSTLPPP